MENLLQILGKVGFDWHMSLFNFINFLVAFWILKKFAFGPLVKIIEARQQKAQEAMENFEKARTEISSAKQEAEKIVQEGKERINFLMSEAQKEAKRTVEISKDKAKEETQKVIEDAKKTISAEKEKMIVELRQETSQLIVLATEKILKEKIKDTDDAKYISKVIKEINE